MREFINDDFLLQTPAARDLYHEYAAGCRVYDYHCHLPASQIAENRVFRNLYEVWLAGDHYKWRAMRANGIDEEFCTGNASDFDKFAAYARTVPYTLRNPLYHWTHLELKRYFGISELLNEDTAKVIWEKANEQLACAPVQDIIARSRVAVICTTDDPTDTLDSHIKIREQGTLRVYPTFRPDKALQIDQPAAFNEWVDQLARVSGISCASFASFMDAITQRHDFFHSLGGRLSDHGLSFCESSPCSDEQASNAFEAARAGREVDASQAASFRSYMMLFFGRLDAMKGWTKQLHLGAKRNNSTRFTKSLGPDTGFDSIGDDLQAERLGGYLDALDAEGCLPKMILYNVNPSQNYLFATMAGNFQGGKTPGKIQFGSGWWFLDQKEAMEWQMNALSNIGLLSRFVGMTTDSRSFLSFPRHEYFRRVLCNLIGSDVQNGEIPNDKELLSRLVKGVCFDNAERYFQLDLGQAG